MQNLGFVLLPYTDCLHSFFIVNNNYNKSLRIPPATCQLTECFADVYFNYPCPPFYKYRNQGTEKLRDLPNVIQAEQGFKSRQLVSRVCVLNHLSIPCPKDEWKGSLLKLEGHFCILYGVERDAHPQYMTTSIHLQLHVMEKYPTHKLELIDTEVTEAHMQWKKKNGWRMEMI